MLNHPFIRSLKTRFNEPLPGPEAQFEMAHINRQKPDLNQIIPGNYKSSAVLLLLVKREDGFIIPLTERHTYIGAHSGQVSLPGGKREESDESLQHTALRECTEEIGIEKGVHIIGELTPIYIPVSNFVVNPFVAVFTDESINYELNTKEVKSLLELNLSDLKRPELVKQTTVDANGYKLKTPYFDVQGKVVWGATAMILNEFKQMY